MSTKLDHLYEFAKSLGFTETGPLWETTPSLEVMPDFRIFPNTVRDIKAEVDARIADLTAEVAKALAFIEGIGSDLLNRRVADWYPEGSHSAASSMSEDMRLIGNACMDFDIARNALKDGV